MSQKNLILNSQQIVQKINRIAYEIYENSHEEKEIVMAGIAPNGYLLAQRLSKALKEISGPEVHLMEIRIDKENPYSEKGNAELRDRDFKNKIIVLVDDVLNSGKTLIFGTRLFMHAPVKRLLTAVLVDRNHNRYPVKADFRGLSLSTTLQEHVTVELKGKGKDEVYLS